MDNPRGSREDRPRRRVYVPNKALRVEDIPGPDATGEDVSGFATTFALYGPSGLERPTEPVEILGVLGKHLGYNLFGQVGNGWAGLFKDEGRLPRSMTIIRTCLFFEQRRAHWSYGYGEEELSYVRALHQRLRDVVSGGTPSDNEERVAAKADLVAVLPADLVAVLPGDLLRRGPG